MTSIVFMSQSHSKLEEITQAHPSDATWSSWQQFLKKHIHFPNKDYSLCLGNWWIDANHINCLWLFYYSSTMAQLLNLLIAMIHSVKWWYRRILFPLHPQKTQCLHALHLNTTQHVTSLLADVLTSLLPDAVPCDANDTTNIWEICDHHYPYVSLSTIAPPSTPTLLSFIAKQRPYINQF